MTDDQMPAQPATVDGAATERPAEGTEQGEAAGSSTERERHVIHPPVTVQGVSHSATFLLVGDGQDRHCVIEEADEIIWISEELMRMAGEPDRERFPGDLEIDGDRVSFGTPGEGLGRLTYRVTGHHEHQPCVIAERTRDV